ncbi:MAG TPA: hypothetical protein PKM25_10145 [Candidatus Ozemobacteraceae bacterium]|nr:hypothetical protein [Candidatus Ozemobacteraceae bacterium]
MNKEQIYDTEIAPLITKIFELCKKHGIAMVADFAIPTTENPYLGCFTSLPDENGKRNDFHIQIMVLKANVAFAAMAIRTMKRDGETEHTTSITPN